MALRINPFSKINNDTGFGASSSGSVGRFVNRDGSFNLRKEGGPVWQRLSLYTYHAEPVCLEILPGHYRVLLRYRFHLYRCLFIVGVHQFA